MKLFKILLFGLLVTFWFAPLIVAKAAVNESNQYYSVVFDKEQEAAVVAKLTYNNTGRDEIKNITLEIPGSTVRIISAVQEQASTQPYCKRYDYNAPTNSHESPYPCLEYGQQTSSEKTYALLDASKITNNIQSSTLILEFKQPIASQQSGTVILYYKTLGLANKVWNGYKYAFETIKSPYDIDSVRVAINVADDLYIKETAKGETNYTKDIPAATDTLTLSTFSASESLSKASTSIQTSPGVIKETSSLDPNENFRVEGKFYDNSWMGELPTIIGVGITFLIIVFVLVVVIKRENK